MQNSKGELCSPLIVHAVRVDLFDRRVRRWVGAGTRIEVRRRAVLYSLGDVRRGNPQRVAAVSGGRWETRYQTIWNRRVTRRQQRTPSCQALWIERRNQ